MKKFEHAGEVGVDAGLIWVGDPCYIMGDDASSRVTDWSDFCQILFSEEKNSGEPLRVHQPLGRWTGLAISSGYGDGIYPVYVRKNLEGRISAILVDFGLENLGIDGVDNG